MKILFAASECVPFVKTGGLADVVGALPQELLKLGHDVRVILPKYAAMAEEHKEKLSHVCHFQMPLGWRSQYCGIETLVYKNVRFYFVDNEYYFGRAYVYGSFNNDEAERFAYFSKAVVEAMPRIGFFPDVLHCNDWQTGLCPALLKLKYLMLPDYRNVKTALTIHNLCYQGSFAWDFVEELLSLGAENFTADKLEYHGGISFLKAGLVYADTVTTVSPTYAREIQTEAYGYGLDGLLRARSASLTGILNGIDKKEYDPAREAALAANFSVKDLSGKAACKAALQSEMELDARPDTPVVAIVARLTGQKGIDLVERVLADMMRQDLQLCVLGRGEPRYEQLFSWAAWRYPGRVGARYELNEALSRRIYAGADMFLMPSQFEPCGLSQLIAMRYGTLPIVRETGGLIDTVRPYNKFTGEGTGFSFANYNAHEMLYTVERAVSLYKEEPEAWTRMMQRAMRKNFSWDASAKSYAALYAGLAAPRAGGEPPEEIE
ncbi:MAG: glycogen synthase GlgA [Eubacteriales bacterium]|nr:glycogen synthase GlgA [Eubacteriales bacterium]